MLVTSVEKFKDGLFDANWEEKKGVQAKMADRVSTVSFIKPLNKLRVLLAS